MRFTSKCCNKLHFSSAQKRSFPPNLTDHATLVFNTNHLSGLGSQLCSALFISWRRNTDYGGACKFCWSPPLPEFYFMQDYMTLQELTYNYVRHPLSEEYLLHATFRDFAHNYVRYCSLPWVHFTNMSFQKSLYSRFQVTGFQNMSVYWQHIT